MSFRIVRNKDYPDLVEIKPSWLKLLLDLQNLSRKLSYRNLPKNFFSKKYCRVLNFGSGYQNIELNLNYENIDHVDILLGNIQVMNQHKYDLIVATEVLEHIENPLEELKKISSVMTPQGYILITCPFLTREHGAPEDFYRWTQKSLENMLKNLGLKIVFSEKRGGIFSVTASLWNYYFFCLMNRYHVWILFFSPILGLIHILALWELFWAKKLFFMPFSVQKDYYLGVTILAQKP